MGIKVALAATDDFKGFRARAGLEADAERILSETGIEGIEAAAAAEPLEAPVATARPDPAVAAYRTWCEAYGKREKYLAAYPDIPDEEPGFARLLEAEHAAEEALVDAVPTTPEGVAGKLNLLLMLLGCADFPPADFRRPGTFTTWGGPDRERCAMTMFDGLRGMA